MVGEGIKQLEDLVQTVFDGSVDELFAKYIDKDGKGCVARMDFLEGIKSLGCNLTRAEGSELMAKVCEGERQEVTAQAVKHALDVGMNRLKKQAPDPHAHAEVADAADGNETALRDDANANVTASVESIEPRPPLKVDYRALAEQKRQEEERVVREYKDQHGEGIRSFLRYSQQLKADERVPVRDKGDYAGTRSIKSHLGGVAVGLDENELVDAGYANHVGKWRGFPFDSWSCCQTSDKYCPVATKADVASSLTSLGVPKSPTGKKATPYKAPVWGTNNRGARQQVIVNSYDDGSLSSHRPTRTTHNTLLVSPEKVEKNMQQSPQMEIRGYAAQESILRDALGTSSKATRTYTRTASKSPSVRPGRGPVEALLEKARDQDLLRAFRKELATPEPKATVPADSDDISDNVIVGQKYVLERFSRSLEAPEGSSPKGNVMRHVSPVKTVPETLTEVLPLQKAQQKKRFAPLASSLSSLPSPSEAYPCELSEQARPDSEPTKQIGEGIADKKTIAVPDPIELQPSGSDMRSPTTEVASSKNEFALYAKEVIKIVKEDIHLQGQQYEASLQRMEHLVNSLMKNANAESKRLEGAVDGQKRSFQSLREKVCDLERHQDMKSSTEMRRSASRSASVSPTAYRRLEHRGHTLTRKVGDDMPSPSSGPPWRPPNAPTVLAHMDLKLSREKADREDAERDRKMAHSQERQHLTEMPLEERLDYYVQQWLENKANALDAHNEGFDHRPHTHRQRSAFTHARASAPTQAPMPRAKSAPRMRIQSPRDRRTAVAATMEYERNPASVREMKPTKHKSRSRRSSRQRSTHRAGQVLHGVDPKECDLGSTSAWWTSVMEQRRLAEQRGFADGKAGAHR
jgi:hypothetical protein